MDKIKESAGRIKQWIEKSENIVIATHLNPDGDALGSGLALLNLLKNLGKKCHLITPNDPPAFLMWMESAGDIMVFQKKQKQVKTLVENSDLIIYTDFNDLARLGDASSIFENIKKSTILIDHHPDPLDFADILISETNVGSASELVYELIKEMGLLKLMDKGIAECIYVGIMTDTGNFSFACSYPEVWRNISELINYNINRDNIYSQVYDNYKVERMKLMGYCLCEKMKVLPELNSAIISLSEKEMKDFNYEPGDTEGFVNLPFSIKGLKVSVLLLEKKDYIKLSFRSRGDFSVNDFSRKYFSGGGHKNAAGGESSGTLESTIERLELLLEKYKDDLK